MKVWEFEEGKIYICGGSEMKLEDGILKSASYNNDGSINHWYESKESFNYLKTFDFEEVDNKNTHWKPKNEGFIYILNNFSDIGVGNSSYINNEDVNMFHFDDRKKVECLALEFKIKSVLLNWRRLYDNVDLDWIDKDCSKFFIGFDTEDNEICIDYQNIFCENSFGHFSSKEKAKQFYEYMKEDIDKYFKMRKELKF